MKHTLKSAVTTTGRRMAGARSLWRANGMREEQFGRPVIGIANSFTQLVPGHVHLHEIGQYVKQRIEALGCFAAEFNTIAVDDGIAMGHDGMLYSLPSREIIADSVEYMASAHKIDALVCISNCDKITPGMLMAAMRLNIPTVFVSGGPMEAGKFQGRGVDLIDAMVMGADETCSDAQIAEIERCACPGCGSCSGMFTANSMNCLTEALGLSLPGNGTIVATHVNRRRLFEDAAALIVRNAERYYFEGDERVLPRSIATKAAFENAMSLDIAMGGSTNTVLHLLAVAHEAGVDFTMQDIDRLSRRVPVLCKVAPTRTTTSRTSTAPEASSPFWASLTVPDCSTPRSCASTGARWAKRSRPATFSTRQPPTPRDAARSAPRQAITAASWAHSTPTTKNPTPIARRAASATWSTPISATADWPC